MGTTFDWENANVNRDYPFKQVITDNLHALIGDGLVVDNSDEHGSVYLSNITIISKITFSYEVNYLSDDSNFFEGSPSLETLTEFGNWYILTVTQTTPTEKHLRLLINKEAVTLPMFNAVPLGEKWVFIDEIVIQPAAKVTSVRFVDEDAGVDETLGVDFTLKAGYNVELTAETSGNILDVDVNPGLGQGLYPNECTDTGLLRTINGVAGPETGEFSFDAESCYSMVRLLIQTIDDTYAPVTVDQLFLQNQCNTCCTCEDYGHTYQALTKLFDRAKAAHDRYLLVRAQYNILREFMLARDEPDNYARIQCIPVSGRTVKILVGLYNVSDEEISVPNVSVRFEDDEENTITFDSTVTTSYYYFSEVGGPPWRFYENMVVAGGSGGSVLTLQPDRSGAVPGYYYEDHLPKMRMGGGYYLYGIDITMASTEEATPIVNSGSFAPEHSGPSFRTFD